ncbi:FadR/GntR family transcriptional regulator [Fundicoccus culcitae]|uniref:FadR family transcriptional regulator n=1 Tax=Fundicoccus culcitae TaxID=2969821 RepID=A0ABY5P5C0_9LACT|nr:FadR/GntR family transcriptional regulator [Fundicoccus culcitae]UUX33805.1 FadR family transcriptional regulator [Fundicoccus culcitae]
MSEEKLNHQTLSEKTAERIFDFIIKNGYQVGSKLPNEFTLAKELEVGRSTLREAIKILASQNIVEVKHGSGTYVKNLVSSQEDPLGFSQVEDTLKLTQDLFEMRFLIEPRMASLAAIHATDVEIDVIEQIVKAVEVEIEKDDAMHFQLDIQLHSAIAEASRNIAMKQLLPIIIESIQLYNDYFTSKEIKQATIESHREIAQAIRRRDSWGAYDAMSVHISQNRMVLNQMSAKNKSTGSNPS